MENFLTKEDTDRIIKILSSNDTSVLTCDIPEGYGRNSKFVLALLDASAKIFFVEQNNFLVDFAYRNMKKKSNVGYANDGNSVYSSRFISKINGDYSNSRDNNLVYVTPGHMEKIFLDFIKYYYEQRKINFTLCDFIIINNAENRSVKNDMVLSLWKYLYDLRINVPKLILLSSKRIDMFQDSIFYNLVKPRYNTNVFYHNKDYRLGKINMYDDLISVITSKHFYDRTYITNNTSDTWLVICPSVSEIEYLANNLRKMNDSTLKIIQFEQDINELCLNKIFSTENNGIRKLIIACNNVEFSIEIKNITYLFDTMLEKQYIESSSGGTKTELAYICKEDAERRSRKVGINCSGNVYRMCTLTTYTNLPEEKDKDINFIPLNNLILKMGKYNINLKELIPHISNELFEQDLKILRELRAIENIDKNTSWVNKKTSLIKNDNFILIEDRKHTDKNIHLLAIVKDKSIETIADLKIKDIPLLEEIKNVTLKYIEDTYGNNKIEMYFHYPPSAYILHLHFTLKIDNYIPYFKYDDVIDSIVSKSKIVYRLPYFKLTDEGYFISHLFISPKNAILLHKLIQAGFKIFPYLSLVSFIDSFSDSFFYYVNGADHDKYWDKNFKKFKHSSDLGILMNVWLKFIELNSCENIRYSTILNFCNTNSLSCKKFNDFISNFKKLMSVLKFLGHKVEIKNFNTDEIIKNATPYVSRVYEKDIYTIDAEGLYGGYSLDDNLSVDEPGERIVALTKKDKTITLSLTL